MLVLALALVAAGGIDSVELLRSRTGGHAHYGILGIFSTQKGTLLAYARARKSLRGDWGKIDGRTWTKKTVIEAGFAGYSDLALGRDGTIYCFYEQGSPVAGLRLARLPRASFE